MPLNEIESWQAEKKNIRERVKFMFNNSLISDISFLTRDLSGAEVVYPAHKFVLAISSPVFYAMFYGDLSESKTQIELPDCDSQSFVEFLRFLYCDESNLTGSNVMQVYYLAKKYIVPELENTCLGFLMENLSPLNVFDILPQALKFEDTELISRCWEVVDFNTEEAIKSDSFLSISKELLDAMLERDTLSVFEVDLFQAVDRWAVAQCGRQEIEPSKENKRMVTGEDTVKNIRFPLMTERQFADAVPESGLLHKDDIISLFMWFNNITVGGLKYSKRERRRVLPQPLSRCKRFREFEFVWSYLRGALNEITFSVDAPIFLAGVRLFGSSGCTYEVVIKIFSETYKNREIYSLEGLYKSDKENTDEYFGYDVILRNRVPVEVNTRYKISVLISGVSSCYGTCGLTTIECDGIHFNFIRQNSSNGTNQSDRQIAEILFQTRE